VGWLVEANISEKCGVFTSALNVETARFIEMLSSASQSTRRLQSKQKKFPVLFTYQIFNTVSSYFLCANLLEDVNLKD
jgi:hypothetical protein